MNNAIDFISAYNVIDARLRAVYRGKGNLQFSDLVRRCAEFHPIVSKYEEELLSFARLRNAIVHNSVKEHIIAQPSDEATALIRRIAEALSSPPRLSRLRDKRITGISAEESLAAAVCKIVDSGHSNLPVYRGGRVAGMLNNRTVVRVIGLAVRRGEDVDEVLRRPCEEALSPEDMTRYYKVLSKQDSVQDALDAFEENRKLLAVIVTETGRIGDAIVNLITSADLPALIKLLED